MTRVRGALVWLLAPALAVATGCGPLGGPPDPESAQGRVEALERALVEADSTTLVEMVQDPRFDVSTALLTDEVLAHGALAGQDVDLEKTGTNLETVRYALQLPGDTGRPWLEPELRRSGEFVSQLPKVELSGTGVTSVTINGAEVQVDALPNEGQSFYLPPGEYDIGVGGADRFVDHGPTQQLDTRRSSFEEMSFPGKLNAVGRARVDRAVKRFVKTCTEPRRGNRPAGCPARKAFLGGVDYSQWTLAAYPRTIIEQSGAAWRVETPEPPVARMRGVIRDRGTGATEQVTDTVPFAVSGAVSVRGDELLVEIPGY